MDPEERQAHVLVPEDQLSLAIGKEGQNVRLAARLTGWKLDIKDTAKYDYDAEEDQRFAEILAARQAALEAAEAAQAEACGSGSGGSGLAAEAEAAEVEAPGVWKEQKQRKLKRPRPLRQRLPLLMRTSLSWPMPAMRQPMGSLRLTRMLKQDAAEEAGTEDMAADAVADARRRRNPLTTRSSRHER
jgi:hypothetical protein